MAKTPWTDEQRKAAGDRLRLAREKKQQLKEQADAPGVAPEAPAPQDAPAPELEPTITQTEYKQLLEHLAQMQAQLTAATRPAAAPAPTYAPQQPQVNPTGQLTGTFEKYIVDPKNYPDPTDRLAHEPRLRRFAFDINYELDFKVTTVQYKTIDGINVREPKFTIQLIKVVEDKETGEPTDGRFVLRTLIAHEDPQAALTIASEQGLDPDAFGGEKAFLDEMRYLRIRDWLLEAFYPPRNTSKTNKREMVIGNRVVEYYEKSSVDPAKVNFDGLDGKV